MGAQFWSVYVPTLLTGDDAVSATLEQVDAARVLTERYADQLAWATTADEVEEAWASDRIASLAGAEGETGETGGTSGSSGVRPAAASTRWASGDSCGTGKTVTAARLSGSLSPEPTPPR